MRYYEKRRHRLVYYRDQGSSHAYWDQHWANSWVDVNRIPLRSEITRTTRRYLSPENGLILEGGCGGGQHVLALTTLGYRCIGLDYAPSTLQRLKTKAARLNLALGEIQSLCFSEACFSGYWSLGVIEHFRNGYGDAAWEMARVLQPGGYLFLTFPYMSPLRNLKARLGCYESVYEFKKGQEFYQFVLDHKRVVQDFQVLGFELVKSKPLDGLKGFKDEIPLLLATLQRLYDYRGRSFLIRGGRFLLSRLLSTFAGHAILLVFRRRVREG